MTITQPQKMISLLCVEDDPLTQELLCQSIAMKFPALKMHSADNGKVGLELFRRWNPDIILTDISMPIMDGVQMAAEIRALAPKADIIVITGHNDLQYLLDALRVGITGYLVKPLSHEQLFKTIEDCIAKVMLPQATPKNEILSDMCRND